MDTGVTDHLTHDLDRMNIQELYQGKDQVQVANGTCLSIAHVGNSCLVGFLKPLALKNVPSISNNFLSVYRLVSEYNIFIELNKHFYLIRKSSRGTSSFAVGAMEAFIHSCSVEPFHLHITHPPASNFCGFQWHQRLGHPSNNVVHHIMNSNNFSCSPNIESSVCDDCQHAKSHQLPYNHLSRVSHAPLEIIHTDVWGPTFPSS
jgi:histone deacetylase 1/2